MRSATCFLVVLISAAAVAGDADTLKSKALRYVFTINSAVLLCATCASESGSIALPTTIHGIQYKKLRLGAGIGYTSFGPVRTMPVFGSIACNFFGKKRQSGLFMEFNYGGAHAWLSRVVRDSNALKDVDAWGFTQISLGYAYRYEKMRIAVQAGFQGLKTRRQYEYGDPYYYQDLDFYLPPRREIIDYNTNRFFIGLSLGI